MIAVKLKVYLVFGHYEDLQCTGVLEREKEGQVKKESDEGPNKRERAHSLFNTITALA
jgi:hypothetical protein